MIRALIFSFLFLNSQVYSQDLHLVEAGKGFEEVQLGSADIKDIKDAFGKRYKLSKGTSVACGFEHCWYWTSTFIRYRKGLAFLFSSDEPNRGKKVVQGELTCIEISPPFKAATRDGIKLAETSYKDLIEIRGGAQEIRIEKGYLIAFYDGIEFYFEAESPSNKNLSYTDFLDAPLIRIAITKKESS